MISACIIVRNEERYLGRLLASLDACPDIVVLDTGSSDRTVAIAAGQPGVRVRHFDWTRDFSEARNAAAGHALHEWILWLDADMFFPEGELEKILAFLPRVPANVDGIALRILDAAAAFPSPRLYRRHLRFSGAVHEDPGCTCVMQTPFVVHHQREESLADRRDKDQRYEAMLQSELAADPNSVHALMYLRDLSFQRKDYPQATAYIERLLQLENDYLCHYDLAIIAAEQRQFTKALEHGFRALQSSCLDPRLYTAIADAYDELGRKVEALVFYEQALHLPDEARLIGTKYAVAEDDFHVVPLVNKAKVLLDLGLKDKALACYDEALRRNPNTPYRHAIEGNRAVIQDRR